ncbi:hypothetical protein BAE36_32070 [Rhizobium leguminosarum bv. trifolii]|uniref:Uncharacterized protein n=1 Tax=Rhizobium leguminosarum bv. trifolii TaxID=386 RepID=A0A1B8R2X7_RHILT|nr:hypothetical protein [Rhizobium leguminosarum]AOO94062.1 hypothetical protein [Rhizobium leguminosarum bv. trifolii]OBY03191.1 hypothetical protein BAE36_32070 [Rhizobium leguminosarum bv. trifolii]TBY18819.1 hypothetical protein E0H30_21370 [Rhizobium leguminosarum bv. viciae]TBY27039.1 hypothetical protein E0H37_18680 [Rhizobium leguminosarum bv. viciae]TBZ02062.1 hypothetical protein E0H49_10635 [Rhizobium leguminosarum bv. viciae]
MSLKSKLSAAWRKTEHAIRATTAFVIKPRTTLAETENAAAQVDSIASLWNNAVWSGGLLLAIQVIKTNSGVGGFKWFCMTTLEVAMAFMMLMLGLAAVLLITDRINEGRSDGQRAFVSLGLIVIFLILGFGFLFTLGEYMMSPAAGIVPEAK